MDEKKKDYQLQITQWLLGGIIKPSCSDYASLELLDQIKDNSMRLRVDFHKLKKLYRIKSLYT